MGSVEVLRDRQSGAFILNPKGTFKGYGAYVGINPYRELHNTTLNQLGQLIVDLLELSGPQPYHIKEFETYLSNNTDEETKRIRHVYFPSNKLHTTGSLARRFAHGGVEFKPGQKSWLVCSAVYDPTERVLNTNAARRVKLAGGTTALGAAISELLDEV